MKKMMNIYFVYKKVVIGGCELLIERLAKELIRRSINVNLVYQEIDQNMLTRYKNIRIQLIKIDFWNRKSLLSKINLFDDVYIVSFTWTDFQICNARHEKLHTIFYAVHYQAFEFSKNKFFLIKKFFRLIGKKGVTLLNKNRQLISMDEQTNEYTKQLFGLSNLEIPILRLAIDSVPEMKRNLDDNTINILTIARADFPFKGYLIGLIEWFAESMKNIYLTIISYGPDEELLSQKIASLPPSVRNRIEWYGKTDYNHLEDYYKKASIYVGMGTTVLDASLRGVVSIPVQAYTYQLVAEDFLFNDYSKVAIDEGNLSRFDDLIVQYESMDKDERKAVSDRSRHIVMENYNTISIVDELIQMLESSGINCLPFGLELYRWYQAGKAMIKRRKIKDDNAQ